MTGAPIAEAVRPSARAGGPVVVDGLPAGGGPDPPRAPRRRTPRSRRRRRRRGRARPHRRARRRAQRRGARGGRGRRDHAGHRARRRDGGGAGGGRGSGWVYGAGPRGHRGARRQPRHGSDRRTGRPAEIVGVAPCEDLALLRTRLGRRGRSSSPASRDWAQGESVLAFGYPEDGAAGRARVLHPRRGLRGAHGVPRPGAGRARAIRRRSAPTRRSTPASRAARSSTSTGR